jgi:hypothetical protein
VIVVVAFWVVAAVVASRWWIAAPSVLKSPAVIGLRINTALEWVAIHVQGRWAYGASMAIVPVLQIGLAPVLQWLILPPLIVWFVTRQLAGSALRR